MNNIIKLRKAATTGAIASVKKFKRVLSNNDSEISRTETESMMNPDTPYVNVIANPMSYKTQSKKMTIGDGRADDEVGATAPNAIDFNNMDPAIASM